MAGYQYEVGVFIGRFQPFHYGHLHVIKAALQVCARLIIIVGSANRAATVRNPFTYAERRALLINNFKAYDAEHGTDLAERIVIVPVNDQLYYEARWISDVTAAVLAESKPNARIALIGYDKDKSTYYLKKFPQWAYVSVENYQGIDATRIRRAYFTGQDETEWAVLLPKPSQAFLAQFKAQPLFTALREEQNYLITYREAWAKAPYPPKFVTTDAVVTCCGHILLIQRKLCPGKGLWGLPGGHLEPEEWIQQGLLRELREETAISCSHAELVKALLAIHPFDHPQRSQVGRVITHAGFFKLTDANLPGVTASDDAAAARWVPLKDFSQFETRMHDDHYQIVQYFLREYPV